MRVRLGFRGVTTLVLLGVTMMIAGSCQRSLFRQYEYEEEIYLKLEGVNIREQATKLTQKEVWLPEEEFKKFSARSSPINLLGYTIVEGEQVLGKILEVIEQPHQILCKIEFNKKEAYIPLHEETIRKIDKKNQQVIVSLPPGLLEIYL